MKLLTKTSLNFISVSVFFFLIGSIVMYFSVLNIIQNDLEDRLLQEKKELIDKLDFYHLKDLSSNLVIVKKIQNDISPSFSDSVVIINDKYVLYRKLDFSYCKFDQCYKVSILKDHSQSDLLIMKIVIMNVGFAMFFFFIVFFVNRAAIKNALKVFYSTIDKLHDFQIKNDHTLTLDVAEVQEIRQLNQALERMSKQIRKDFEEQKQYTENITHELQTPLSIITTKVDELLQSDNLSKEQMEKLSLLIETTNRLSKINKSLILLTKIDNRFYSNSIDISLNDLVNDTLYNFKDIINAKNIKIEVNLLDNKKVNMDKYLAETMIANLLKNAIIHNSKGGEILIELTNQDLIITNSGNKLAFAEKDIFKRFSRSEYNKQSLGIGLSIVKRICDLYNFSIDYRFSTNHIFSIHFG